MEGIVGHLGALGRPSWGSWGPLWASGGPSGGTWDHLGGHLGHLGSYLGDLWDDVGPRWLAKVVLFRKMPFRSDEMHTFGATLGLWWAILRPLEGHVEALGGRVGASWGPLWASIRPS